MTVVYTDEGSDDRDLFTAAINEALPGTKLLYSNLPNLLRNGGELLDNIFLVPICPLWMEMIVH